MLNHDKNMIPFYQGLLQEMDVAHIRMSHTLYSLDLSVFYQIHQQTFPLYGFPCLCHILRLVSWDL